MFGSHIVAYINKAYYDPSYGIKYDDAQGKGLLAWNDRSVAGLFAYEAVVENMKKTDFLYLFTKHTQGTPDVVINPGGTYTWLKDKFVDPPKKD